MEVLVGLRVVRGPDWRWGDQDGGEGHVGTVVEVGEPCNDGVGAVVQWDCGERCKYMCGQDGKYDLRVLDSAPAGIGFGPYSICHGCMEEDIKGFGWKCTCCIHYTLCSYCYFSGKHLLDHQFARFDAVNTRSFVSPRSNAKNIMAKGLFPGAKVKRGPDMKSRDVKVNGSGEILDSGSRSIKKSMQVKWDKTGEVTECRTAGTDGKVEILCVEPALWCCYYPEHLPSLGAPKCPPKATEIMSGDLVQVQLDSDVFRMMQTEECGGWNDRMSLFVGRLGCVKNLNDKGNLYVCYHGELKHWVINPDAVVKVESLNFVPDDFVRVVDDAEKLMSLQLSAGIEWTEDTCDCLGKVVKVKSVSDSGVVSVVANQKMYDLSPMCLIEESDELLKGVDELRLEEDRQLGLKVQSLLADGNPNVVAYAAKLGDVHVIREYLKNYPNEVNSKVEGKAPIHWAVQTSSVDAVKCLLEHHADVNVLDDFCQTPLYYCIMYSTFVTSEKIALLLLDGGADPNTKGIDGFTPVLKAIVGGDIRALKVLVKHPKTDIYQEDEDGEIPLHRAILSHHETPVKLLLDAGADPTRLNKKKKAAVHLACDIGNTGALKEILDHNPELINLKDSENGCTPLLHAILHHNQSVVSFLVRQPSCDINAKTKLNRTALHGAVIQGEAGIIELLVGYGADLNVQDAEQSTPLHIVTHMTGADTSEFDFGLPGSATPDFLKGRLSMAGINPFKMLQNVAEFKISDKTPKLSEIREAIGREVSAKAVVACFLIQEGASLHVRNILGQTPLESCTDPVLATVLSDFAEKNAGKGTFYGSLCQNRPVISQAMPKPRSNSSAHKMDTQRDEKMSIVQDCNTSNAIESDCNDAANKLCELCEEETVDVIFLPCGHKVLCHLCAVRAVRCLVCKMPVKEKKSI